MKKLLLGLLIVTSRLAAQPVDLLQQLYGKPSGTASKTKAASPTEEIASELVTLVFRDSYNISRERLYLGDLVDCKGAPQRCADLGAIDLGPAPKPLRQDRITREKISEIVQKEFPTGRIDWQGSQQCLISGLSSPFNDDAVASAIEREFRSAPAGMRVLIQSVRLPTTQMLRHNNYSYRVAGFNDQITRVFASPRTRFAQIKVQAVDQDPSSQSVIEFTAQVNLRVEIEALVATQTRERGERLVAESVELQWIPFQDQVVTDPATVAGKLLKSRVLAKQALRTWDLTREPEVMRGDRIEITIQSGGVKMNSVGQALEPGFIGQKIRIRLEATKKSMLGTVIARSQVEVPSL